MNKTMSEELISYWIKKSRSLFECEKKERKELEKHKRLLEQQLKRKKNMNYPDDKDSTDMLFPHEFLFLLCNAKNRLDIISKMPKPEFTIEKKSIKKYDMPALDARRLDNVYKIEMEMFHPGGSYNP